MTKCVLVFRHKGERFEITVRPPITRRKMLAYFTVVIGAIDEIFRATKDEILFTDPDFVNKMIDENIIYAERINEKREKHTELFLKKLLFEEPKGSVAPREMPEL